MSGFQDLQARIDEKAVIILDGAIGTQLQAMEVPMNREAWAALALETHPFTVRRLHEDYIEAGVDVITTNTYASCRQNLELLGMGDKVAELNLRAVMLAQDARDKCAKERPVYIGGSVSNFGMVAGVEAGWRESYPNFFKYRFETSEAQAKANLREQAEILAEAGVDFMIAEPTGSTVQRRWVVEACAATGLPVWVGFKCHQDAPGQPINVGYVSEEPLEAAFDEVMALGGSLVTVFHSPVEPTLRALDIVKTKWQGPLGVYPEAERHDYVAARRDPSEPVHVTPEDFLGFAKDCVGRGVQVIGGCCGIELDHIRPLREALPERLPEAA